MKDNLGIPSQFSVTIKLTWVFLSTLLGAAAWLPGRSPLHCQAVVLCFPSYRDFSYWEAGHPTQGFSYRMCDELGWAQTQK